MGRDAATVPRTVSLNGMWEFRKDASETWGFIPVPGVWERVLGPGYDGAAWYRRRFNVPTEWGGGRVWLEFQAVMTEATAWVDGREVGAHAGGWTSWRFEIMKHLQDAEDHEVLVRVEKNVGHTTHGFLQRDLSLPFGGMWQGVWLRGTGRVALEPHPWIEADAIKRTVTVSARVSSLTSEEVHLTAILSKWGGQEGRASAQVSLRVQPGGFNETALMLRPESLKAWDPDHPHLYDVELIICDSAGVVLDQQRHRIGARTFEVKGRQFLLNGRPLYVRGILHWGYYPDQIAPTPNEAVMRKELLEMKAHGFNLVKVCLLVFPRRFYELADELGMLVWQEYPIWQRPIEASNRDRLTREYTEFYLQDRLFPSLVLRDLTCENGEADHAVLEELVALGRTLIPGAVIEDSSNVELADHQDRADFYDCHPYYDHEDFLNHVAQWKAFLAGHPAKPLLLGESMDSDTFRAIPHVNHFPSSSPLPPRGGEELSEPRDTGERSPGEGEDQGEPWWLPVSYQAQLELRDSFIKQRGPAAWDALIPHSYAHALSHRKFQIEHVRRLPESGGYVMTAIRDIRLTTPGLYTDAGELKWPPEAWQPFNGDTVLLLKTPDDRRVCQVGESFPVQVLVSHYGKEPMPQGTLRWSLSPPSPPFSQEKRERKYPSPPRGGRGLGERGEEQLVHLDAGTLTEGLTFSLAIPDLITPTELTLRAALHGPAGVVAENAWSLWVFPRPIAEPDPRKVLITNQITPAVVSLLERGGRVLHLADGQGWPRVKLPFWREAVAMISDHSALGDFPHQGFFDLQFLGLAQRRMVNLSAFRHQAVPIVEVINCRDMRLGTLVFEAQVGQGRLLVSALVHGGSGNPAGRYLRDQFIRYLMGAATPLDRALPLEALASLGG